MGLQIGPLILKNTYMGRASVRAEIFFQERPDKEWGLTDCVSFVIMTERKISAALTTDVHFEQAGFQVLLRKESR